MSDRLLGFSWSGNCPSHRLRWPYERADQFTPKDVGGDFTRVSGQTRNRLAAIGAYDGWPTAWSYFAPEYPDGPEDCPQGSAYTVVDCEPQCIEGDSCELFGDAPCSVDQLAESTQQTPPREL